MDHTTFASLPSMAHVKPFLDSAALLLSLVNGLMLLRGYLRDRAVLKVTAIHPDTYQWYFRLPNGEYQGKPTRRFGFLAYIGISNRGRRDVCLTAWRLRGRTKGWRRFERVALSIQEPTVQIGDCMKVFPVLGTKGIYFSGETMVKSGASISGFCYYTIEFHGGPFWDLRAGNGTTVATIAVQNVFEQTSKVKIIFREIALERANSMIPNIASIDARAIDSFPASDAAESESDVSADVP